MRKMVDLVICNWSHFLNKISNCLLHSRFRDISNNLHDKSMLIKVFVQNVGSNRQRPSPDFISILPKLIPKKFGFWVSPDLVGSDQVVGSS